MSCLLFLCCTLIFGLGLVQCRIFIIFLLGVLDLELSNQLESPVMQGCKAGRVAPVRFHFEFSSFLDFPSNFGSSGLSRSRYVLIRSHLHHSFPCSFLFSPLQGYRVPYHVLRVPHSSQPNILRRKIPIPTRKTMEEGKKGTKSAKELTTRPQKRPSSSVRNHLC